jgi:hypothetical protein
MHKSIAVLLICGFFTGYAFSLGQSELPIISAVRITEAPIIDGRVNEEIWLSAPVLDSFWQMEPDDGQPATEHSEVRILYDDRALYISFICYDSEPGKIIRRLTRRDRRVSSDYVAIGIDSYLDRMNAFIFEINAAGVKRDLIMMEDGGKEDVNWDGIWDAAVAMRNDGWSAEFRIPFQTLRFKSKGEQVWGFNAARQIERKKEFVLWAHVPQGSRSVVSRFGTLRGLHDLDAPRSLLFLPYVLTGATRWPSNKLPEPVNRIDPDIDIGLDVQYGVSNNVTLNVTVNPDFGQVELDEVILNLSAFETFYPERRPFFMEGTSIFRTVGALGDGLLRTHMFYTRRIGSQPSGFHFLPDSVDVSVWRLKNNPSASPILGALKGSGKTGVISFGVMNAVTGRTHKVLQGPDDQVLQLKTEALSNYSVGRIQYELPTGSSYIGAIATSVLREDGLTQRAFSGGLDWQYNINDYRFSTDGLLAMTHRAAENGIQEGYHAQARIGSQGNEYFNGMVGTNIYSPDFNPNDIGFNTINNFAIYYIWIEARYFKPFSIVRRIQYNQFNYTSHLIEPNVKFLQGIEPYLGITWINYWFTESGMNIESSMNNPFESRGYGIYKQPAKYNWWFYSRTDNRKTLTYAVNGSMSRENNGGRTYRIGLPITVSAGDRTEFSISPSYSVTENQVGWVSNAVGIVEPDAVTSVFGRRDVDQINSTVRITHTFTTDLNIQAYAQYFWARGFYDEFYRLEEDGSLSPLGVSYDKQTFRNPDFNQSALNVNFIVRYEYRPGSTLFIVWTHSRSEWIQDHTIGAGSFFNRTFETPSTNVLMLKLTHAIGL